MQKGGKPIETLYRGYRFRSRLEARWAVFFDRARIPWRYEPEGYDLSAVKLPSDLPVTTAHWLLSQLFSSYKPYTPGDLQSVDHAIDALFPLVYIDSVDERDKPGSPMWYLPDFYLPEQDCWVEIKPSEPSAREKRMMQRLVWATGKPGYIFWDLRPPSEVLRSTLPADIDRRSALGFSLIEDPVAVYEAITDPESDRVAELFLGVGPNDDPKPTLYASYFNQWSECPHCKMLGITTDGSARYLPCECIDNFHRGTISREAVKEGVERVEAEDAYYTDDAPRLMKAYMAARQARFEHHDRAQVYVLQDKLDRIRDVLDADDT
jgi:hypothetical protein